MQAVPYVVTLLLQLLIPKKKKKAVGEDPILEEEPESELSEIESESEKTGGNVVADLSDAEDDSVPQEGGENAVEGGGEGRGSDDEAEEDFVDFADDRARDLGGQGGGGEAMDDLNGAEGEDEAEEKEAKEQEVEIKYISSESISIL